MHNVFFLLAAFARKGLKEAFC